MTLLPEQQRMRAEQALAAGKISKAEYDCFIASISSQHSDPSVQSPLLQQKPALSQPRRHAALAAAFVLLIAFAAFVFWSGGSGIGSIGGISGLVTLEPQSDIPAAITLSSGGNMTLNITDTATLAISGTLANGSVQVYLHSGNRRLLVYEGDTIAGYRVVTDKESYALGEAVHTSVAPSGAAYTLYLVTTTDRIPISENYTPEAPGEYAIDALINDSGKIAKASTNFTVRADADPANDVQRSNGSSLEFTRACSETCMMDATGDNTLVLETILSDGAQLTITTIIASRQEANHPPSLIADIPALSLRQGETVTVNLSAYFADADQDTLSYNYMSTPETSMAIDGELLSITGIAPGQNESMVYASDGVALVRSNIFTITVEGTTNASENASADSPADSSGSGSAGVWNESSAIPENASTNATDQTNSAALNKTGEDTAMNATNTTDTVVTSQNATTNTTQQALDCSASDPNLRPTACLYQNTSEYFPDDEILLENLDREAVARFTEIGNLLLKGRVIEHSTGTAGPRDFRIGYVDRDGNSVATIWIDSTTGDLHLRGTLVEENTNLVPPAGSYSLMNKRNIFLAYADQQEGTLVVRGNVIPYKLK